MKNAIIVTSLLLSLAACNNSPKVQQAFVCEDDGALVEEHYGVKEVWQSRDDGWLIIYTDGQQAVYRQAIGETCYTEDAPS